MNKQKKFESALENMLYTKPIKNVNKTSNKTKKENKTQKIMKKTKLIFIGILLNLITISCSSDSHDIEDEIVQPSSLVGKWMLSDAKSLNKNNPYEMDDCIRKSSIQFNSNGTFQRIDYFPVSGNICEDDGTEKGTYVYDSTTHKIIIKYEDIDDGEITEVWNNVEITGNVFHYTWDETDDRIDDWKVTYKK